MREICCHCGCGTLITTHDKYGRRHFYKHGHRDRIKYPNPIIKGKDHYNWKGGRSINSQGYVMVRCEGHPRARKSNRYRVREHVLVMEKHLDRYLNQGEEVHHINGNKSDNRIENLQLTNRKEHMRNHVKNGMNKELYDKMRRGIIKTPRDLKSGRFFRR